MNHANSRKQWHRNWNNSFGLEHEKGFPKVHKQVVRNWGILPAPDPRFLCCRVQDWWLCPMKIENPLAIFRLFRLQNPIIQGGSIEFGVWPFSLYGSTRSKNQCFVTCSHSMPAQNREFESLIFSGVWTSVFAFDKRHVQMTLFFLQDFAAATVKKKSIRLMAIHEELIQRMRTVAEIETIDTSQIQQEVQSMFTFLPARQEIKLGRLEELQVRSVFIFSQKTNLLWDSWQPLRDKALVCVACRFAEYLGLWVSLSWLGRVKKIAFGLSCCWPALLSWKIKWTFIRFREPRKTWRTTSQKSPLRVRREWTAPAQPDLRTTDKPNCYLPSRKWVQHADSSSQSLAPKVCSFQNLMNHLYRFCTAWEGHRRAQRSSRRCVSLERRICRHWVGQQKTSDLRHRRQTSRSIGERLNWTSGSCNHTEGEHIPELLTQENQFNINGSHRKIRFIYFELWFPGQHYDHRRPEQARGNLHSDGEFADPVGPRQVLRPLWHRCLSQLQHHRFRHRRAHSLHLPGLFLSSLFSCTSIICKVQLHKCGCLKITGKQILELTNAVFDASGCQSAK